MAGHLASDPREPLAAAENHTSVSLGTGPAVRAELCPDLVTRHEPRFGSKQDLYPWKKSQQQQNSNTRKAATLSMLMTLVS